MAQSRISQDGATDTFLSSLPRGETLIGIYRSKTFAVPERLSFFMAGHNGHGSATPAPKNFIRLRDAATNEQLMEATPPRDDTARKTTWELKKFAGKKAYIELIDGDDATAYAWLAIGRFSPAVVELPSDPAGAGQRMQAAIEIAGQLKLTEAEPRLAEIITIKKFGDGVRAAAATALAANTSEKNDGAFAAILRDVNDSTAIRETAAGALGASANAEHKAALIEALQGAPEKFQTKIALALCQSPAGVEQLLKSITDGKASPRLLLNRAVADRLDALKIAGMPERIGKLTKGLPAVNEQIQGRH